MPNPTQSPESGGSGWSNNLKVIGLVAAIGVLAWIGWAVYSPYLRGLPEEENRQIERRPERTRPRDGDRAERRNRFFEGIDLSEAQRTQLEALWDAGPPDSRDGWRERREAMQAILTEEQREQLRDRFQQRINQRMAEMQQQLSPEDFQAMQERFQGMRERWRDGGGRRGGGDRSGGGSSER